MDPLVDGGSIGGQARVRLTAKKEAGITLEGALTGQRETLETAPALCYTPRRCTFARVREGGLLGKGDHPVPLDDIFELRAFTETHELRWLKDPSGKGKHGDAVLLSEGEFAEESQDDLWRLDGTYLLWGESRGTDRGWTELFEHRVGSVWVPVENEEGNQGRRTQIDVREYLGADDTVNGNMSVRAERLLRLRFVDDSVEGGAS